MKLILRISFVLAHNSTGGGVLILKQITYMYIFNNLSKHQNSLLSMTIQRVHRLAAGTTYAPSESRSFIRLQSALLNQHDLLTACTNIILRGRGADLFFNQDDNIDSTLCQD
jgi:hypothetical protein